MIRVLNTMFYPVNCREFKMPEEFEILDPEPGDIAERKQYAVGTPIDHPHQPKPDMSGARDDDHLIEMFIRSRPSENTQETYALNIRKFRDFIGWEKPLRTVTLADMTEYVDQVKAETLPNGQTLKPASIRTRIDPIKSLMSYAQRLGYLQYNVGVEIELQRPDRIIEDKVLSEPEVERWLDVLEERKDKGTAGTADQIRWLAFYTLYSVGARVTEFISLQAQDFRRDGATGQHYFIFRSENTKGKKTRRVEIPYRIAVRIEKHIQDKGRDDETEPIFSHKVHGQWVGYSRHWVNDFLNKLCKAHQLPKCTPHMLRHSVATHAYQKGMTLEEISYKLGHSGLDITNQTYNHTNMSGAFETNVLSEKDEQKNTET